MAVCAAYLVQDEHLRRLTERAADCLFVPRRAPIRTLPTAAVHGVAQGSQATEHPRISRLPSRRLQHDTTDCARRLRLCLIAVWPAVLLSCYRPCLETICRIKSSRETLAVAKLPVSSRSRRPFARLSNEKRKKHHYARPHPSHPRCIAARH